MTLADHPDDGADTRWGLPPAVQMTIGWALAVLWLLYTLTLRLLVLPAFVIVVVLAAVGALIGFLLWRAVRGFFE